MDIDQGHVAVGPGAEEALARGEAEQSSGMLADQSDQPLEFQHALRDQVEQKREHRFVPWQAVHRREGIPITRRRRAMIRPDDADLVCELATKSISSGAIADGRCRGGPPAFGNEIFLGQTEVVRTGLRVDGSSARLGRRDLGHRVREADMGEIDSGAGLEGEFQNGVDGGFLGSWTPPLEEGLQAVAAGRLEAAA